MEDKTPKNSGAPASPDGRDYKDKDGLLVCGTCGKRKQQRIPRAFGKEGEYTVIPVMCDCEVRREEERQREAEARRRSAKAEKLREGCFPNSGFYRSFTFDADDRRNPVASKACERYAATFDRNDPYGLLLWGDVGTGKSFLSSCIANRVIDLGFSALQTDIGYIVNTMEASFENRRRNLDRILGYDLLLIEDLGAQRATEYMMEHVYAVIDGRYKNGKPMVITTNFTDREISQPSPGSPWFRIFDRISERCFPLEIDGGSRRRGKAANMREIMRKRLDL